MITFLGWTLVLCIVIGIGAFLFSKGSAEERAENAAAAALGTGATVFGCVIQCIMAAIPVILGLVFISLMMRGCS